jgi:hypothetical protein
MYLCGQMYRSTQAKKKFRQITWLVLGVCFVLLYSCPVKKFLIICLDKIPPADNATAQFMKAYSAPGVKISYLHKDATVYAVPSAGRSVRPIDPSSFPFLPAMYSRPGSDSMLQLCARSLSDMRVAIGGPPRYLQLLRLRI